MAGERLVDAGDRSREVFDDVVKEGGAWVGRQAVDWPLTPAAIRDMCESRERVLRAGREGRKLPTEMEQELALHPADDDDAIWARYKLLIALTATDDQHTKHLENDRRVTAALLLRREPIPIRIGDRIVRVSGRSYRAMIHLARHEEALKHLGEMFDSIDQQLGELRALRASGDVSWIPYVRQRRQLLRFQRRGEKQWLRQVKAALACALSPDGRAARAKDLPRILRALGLPEDWWDTIGEDELRIVLGIYQASIRRMLRMSPEKRGPAKEAAETEYGWDTFLRVLEGQLRVPPMSLDDADLAQQWMAFQAGQRQGAANAEVEDLFAA